GGVLSPQALVAEGRALVLDFGKGAMTDAPESEAMHALESEPGVALSGEVKSCGNGGSLPFVHATIAGIRVDAQIDTGATNTTVRSASDVGKSLKPRAKGSNSAVAASGVFTVPTVDGARVKIGALEMDTSVDLVARDLRTQCSNDAFLGMDLFRRCKLVLG